MSPRFLAAAIAAGRLALGAGFTVAPGRLGKIWIGDTSELPGGQVAIRAVGVRDVVLGMGLLMALRRGKPVRGWVEAGMVCDVGDFAFTVLSFRHLPGFSRIATLTSTAGIAGIGMRISGSVDGDARG